MKVNIYLEWCFGLNIFATPPKKKNSYAEVPILNAMVLGGEDLGDV